MTERQRPQPKRPAHFPTPTVSQRKLAEALLREVGLTALLRASPTPSAWSPRTK